MQEDKLEIVNTVISGWKALFDNFLKFFVTFLIPLLGYLFGLGLCVAGIFALLNSATNVNMLFLLPLGLVFNIIGLIVFCYFFWRFLIISASTYIVAKKFFETGEEPDYHEANKAIEARAKDYIILLLILVVIATLPFIIFYLIPISLMSSFPSLIAREQVAALSLVASLFLFLSFIILNIYLTLALPLFVLNENLTPKNSIKLSFSLVGKNFWPTVLVILFFMLTTVPIVLVCFIPVIGTMVINFIWSIISTPLIALVLTKWYLKVTKKTVVENA